MFVWEIQIWRENLLLSRITQRFTSSPGPLGQLVVFTEAYDRKHCAAFCGLQNTCNAFKGQKTFGRSWLQPREKKSIDRSVEFTGLVKLKIPFLFICDMSAGVMPHFATLLGPVTGSLVT